MKAYSTDLRQRVLAAVDGGMKRREVVRLFGVSLATLKRWLAQRRAVGHLTPKARVGAARRIAPGQHALLAAQLRSAPDATLAQHCQRWHLEQGCRVSQATLWRTLHRMQWSHKKRV